MNCRTGPALRIAYSNGVLTAGIVTGVRFLFFIGIVRPGNTGWAQVNQGHVTELDDV